MLDFEKNWKTKTIKEAMYSEENKHHINGISFKLPAIWKPILQKNKEKKNNRQNSTAKNTSSSRLSLDTSATQTNQSAMTTEHYGHVHGTSDISDMAFLSPGPSFRDLSISMQC